MFMVGFDLDTRSYFTFSTSIIAIPTGIKILNWLATIWSSCFFLITPLYFIIGFLFSFTFGGFTGLILANSIIDTILHDSYFIIFAAIDYPLCVYGLISANSIIDTIPN